MTRPKIIQSVLTAMFFATLAVSFLAPTPAQALSGITTQEVNITVLPPPPIPDVPPTGEAAPAADQSSAEPISPHTPIIIVVAITAVIGSIILARRHKDTAKAVPMLALCIITPLLLITPHVIAVAEDPTLDISLDTLDYTLRAGETAHLEYTALATTSPNSTGYTISVLSDDTSEDISLEIISGDFPEYTAVPSAATEDPLLVHSLHANASTGDTSHYTVAATVSSTIAPGTYKMLITYYIDTDEGEFFRFTVDTRLTDTLDTDANHFGGTATTFAIPTSGYVNQDDYHKYNWRIDWGDGTASEIATGTSDDLSPGIPHTYATPGAYQITIWPNGLASAGWLNAFGFYNTNTAANAQSNKNMFYTIDTSVTDSMRTSGAPYRFAYMFFGARNAIDIPTYLFETVTTDTSANLSNAFNSTFNGYATNFTGAYIPSDLFATITTASATNLSGMFTATFFNFASSSTTASIPSGLFATIDTSSATNVSNLFRDTFFGYASASPAATIPADLFSSIRLANGANAGDMFGGTFYFYAGASTSGTIPAGLFSSTDTTHASNVTGMFSGTFSGYARASTSGEIPANLFATINTSNQQSLAYLFNGTFSGYASSSNTTIPAGLFNAISTTSATNLSSMFAGTFASFANNSTVATIPAGLFASVTTATAQSTANMFRDTFSNYAGLSTTATIPAGLFTHVNTAKVTNTSGMFSGAFYFFGHVSPTATIPANLFTGIDLSSATDTYEMFYRSFDSFAYQSTTDTDINSIWGNANFAGRVTSANVSSFMNSTFSNVTRLTGTAQTFIDNKLGGITPASAAHTFATTSVDDLLTIDANWR